ncbi:MAG: TonB-dependent receptor, partial [Saprospiraceae bacterium]|nr:TonB-dependent receptor [Saprospiraceae bacterium]
MKKIGLSLSFLFVLLISYGQEASITGQLVDSDNEPILYANVALTQLMDTTLLKVEVSDDKGFFQFMELDPGNYRLDITFIGFNDLSQNVSLQDGESLDLQVLEMNSSAVDLETATVTASRAMVEVKSDRTVFNVEGTINSTGDNAIGLLRKAPGVLVDNNDNISVLSRSGVLVYIDGKRLPLQGEDLSNYLQNIPAEQIDRMDIITNPSAKYEAEGNAGIIDIRLKKDKNQGANGTISSTLTRGELTRGNANASGNFRNKKLNVYGSVGYSGGKNFNTIDFTSFQNQLQLIESNRFERDYDSYDFRIGTDFFLNQNNTIGFIITGGDNSGLGNSANRI